MGSAPDAADKQANYSLAVVCPMANEADTAVQFVSEVVAEVRSLGVTNLRFFAILDNASTDGTRDRLRAAIAELPELDVVFAPENRCVVDAYLRGYRAALESEAQWILEIDAGYSHRPAEIGRFLAQISDQVDCVFASRFAGGGRFEGGMGKRYWVSRVGTALSWLLLGARLSDMTSGFQLFSRSALQTILAHGLRSRGPFFQTEMKYRASSLRCREVPITYKPTAQDVRPAAIRDALSGLVALLKERLSGRAGVVAAASKGPVE